MAARDDEFADFVAARYRALLRTGLALTGDLGHAEDLAQSALIKTYLAWGRLREITSAEAYARRTLVRLVLRERQRRWHGEISAERRPEPDAPGALWPQHRNLGPPNCTGDAILFPPAMHWCSICSGDYQVFNGFFVISGALDRTVSVRTGPFSFQLPAFVWTGRLIIAVVPGNGNPLPFKLTDLAEYNPSTSAWRPLAAAPRDAHADTLPVWTGSELLAVTEQGAVLALHR